MSRQELPSGRRPLGDLIAELERAARADGEAGQVDPARVRACLQAGADAALLEPTADLDVACALLAGAWRGYVLANGMPPPPGWARRAAVMVWRGCGGAVVRQLPARGGTGDL